MKRVMVAYKQLTNLEGCACLEDLGIIKNKPCLARTYMEVPSDALTAAHLVAAVVSKWGSLEATSSAYHGSEYRAIQVAAVWMADTGRGVIPMTKANLLLSDGLALTPGSRAFFSPPDTSRFRSLSPDTAFLVLRQLPMAEREAALAASPALQSMWGSNSHLDLNVSELIVEVAF